MRVVGEYNSNNIIHVVFLLDELHSWNLPSKTTGHCPGFDFALYSTLIRFIYIKIDWAVISVVVQIQKKWPPRATGPREFMLMWNHKLTNQNVERWKSWNKREFFYKWSWIGTKWLRDKIWSKMRFFSENSCVKLNFESGHAHSRTQRN